MEEDVEEEEVLDEKLSMCARVREWLATAIAIHLLSRDAPAR